MHYKCIHHYTSFVAIFVFCFFVLFCAISNAALKMVQQATNKKSKRIYIYIYIHIPLHNSNVYVLFCCTNRRSGHNSHTEAETSSIRERTAVNVNDLHSKIAKMNVIGYIYYTLF